MKDIFILILILALFVMGFLWYFDKDYSQQKIHITETIAKKDSIKAKQANNQLSNLVHPEWVKVDSAKGLTYIAVRNDQVSKKPLPPLLIQVRDTIVQYVHDEETERKYNDNAARQSGIIGNLNTRIDSLLAQTVTYRESLRKWQTKSDKLPDTIKRLPAFTPYFIGGHQSELMPEAKLSFSLSGAANYSFSRNAFSTGIGLQAAYKHTRVDYLMYYDWATHQPRSVVSVKQDFFKLFSVKNK